MRVTFPPRGVYLTAFESRFVSSRIRRVVLPLLAPSTVVVVALSVINSLKGFDILYIMTGGGPFNSSDTLAMHMYNESFKKYLMGYGTAISVVLFLIALAIIGAVFPPVAQGGPDLWLSLAAASPRFNPWPRPSSSLCCARGAVPAAHGRCALSSLKTTREISMGELWSLPDQPLPRQLRRGAGQPVDSHLFPEYAAGRRARDRSVDRLGSLRAMSLPSCRFRGSNALFLVIVAGMFFPPQVILVPLFRLFNGTGADRHALAGDHRAFAHWASRSAR